MPRLEPALLPVVSDLERGLRLLGVPFAVVGALVPELLLDERPARMTNDADVTVIVESLAAFEKLKDDLAAFGFLVTPAPHSSTREPICSASTAGGSSVRRSHAPWPKCSAPSLTQMWMWQAFVVSVRCARLHYFNKRLWFDVGEALDSRRATRGPP